MTTSLSRRAALGGLGAAAAALALPETAQAATARSIALYRCTGASLAGGLMSGTRYAAGTVVLGAGTTPTVYADPFGARRSYDYGTWQTGWYAPGFGATQVVPSWRVRTPGGSFVTVWVQGRTASGALTSWFSLGRWSEMTGGSPTRMTVDGQSDAYARVSTDTLVARPGVTLTALRLRVALYRPAGSSASPVLSQVTAMASAVPTGSGVTVPVSPVGVARGKVLAVSTYSQMNHRGHYPQFGGGGQAWCSATSTAMVLDYWKAGPTPAERAWVPQPHTDSQVDHVASRVYDHQYRGAGNWAFNTAYAATRGLDAFVTRLRSLAEAERFIAAGIPLPVSTSFTSAQLRGAGFGTAGHLITIVGFDARGDVVVNDPASGLVASDARVRKTYDRAQFENAWARSGGTAYVIRPLSRPLPAPLAQRNW